MQRLDPHCAAAKSARVWVHALVQDVVDVARLRPILLAKAHVEMIHHDKVHVRDVCVAGRCWTWQSDHAAQPTADAMA